MKKILLSLLLLVLLGAVATGVVAWWLISPIQADSQQLKTVVVPRGASITAIGQKLTEQGLVRSPLVFRLAVAYLGVGTQLQAGSFELSPAQNVFSLAQDLTQGTQDIWVTIPEGWRTEQIAEYLQQELDQFDSKTFIELAKPQEGFLYPDTYLVPRQMTAQQMIELLTMTFDKRVLSELGDQFDRTQLSVEEVVTLASLVQRESVGSVEMPLVASVMLNRLEIGQALQIDATLQYVKGYNSTTQSWWSPPLAADKALDSAYNTYQNPGLPPAPIANPGFDAISAVLNPAQTEYFYYLHDPSGKGHFATTYQEHQANIERYLR